MGCHQHSGNRATELILPPPHSQANRGDFVAPFLWDGLLLPLTPRGLLVGGDVGVGVKAAGGKLGLPSSPSPASGAVEWVAL